TAAIRAHTATPAANARADGRSTSAWALLSRASTRVGSKSASASATSATIGPRSNHSRTAASHHGTTPGVRMVATGITPSAANRTAVARSVRLARDNLLSWLRRDRRRDVAACLSRGQGVAGLPRRRDDGASVAKTRAAANTFERLLPGFVEPERDQQTGREAEVALVAFRLERVQPAVHGDRGLAHARLAILLRETERHERIVGKQSQRS